MKNATETFVASQRLIAVNDGSGDTALLALAGPEAVILAHVINGDNLGEGWAVPRIDLDPAAINALLGEEWNWDGLAKEIHGRVLLVDLEWDKRTVEAFFRGILDGR